MSRRTPLVAALLAALAVAGRTQTLDGGISPLCRAEAESLAPGSLAAPALELAPVDQAIVFRLRGQAAAGAVTPDDRAAAGCLYSYRRPLPDADREFLRALWSDPRNITPRLDFGTPAAQSPAAVAAAPTLDAGLSRLLQIDDHGDPRQRQVVERALSDMRASPTARRLAAELSGLGRTIRISFESVPNSAVITRNGKKILQASAGSMDLSAQPPHLQLNVDLLKTDDDYIRRELTDTIGHELLGHALFGLKARQAGPAAAEAYDYYRGDEANAGLTGWVIRAELGEPLDDSYLWEYLRDPERYHKDLQTNLSYYAGTFSPREMADPVAALQDRLKRAEAAEADVPKEIELDRFWLRVIDHFVSVHRMLAMRFQSAQESLHNNADSYYPNEEKNLQEIVDHVKAMLAEFATPAGLAQLTRLKTASADPFFVRAEADLKTMRQRLKKLARHKSEKGEDQTHWPGGQWTEDDVAKMYRKDIQKHPDHKLS